MVKDRYVRALAVVSAAFLGTPVLGSEDLPTVTSLQITAHTPLTIKPCQRVDVQVEVHVDRPVTGEAWRRLTRAMSEVVVVNGEAFRNRLSERALLNSVAAFSLLELSREQRGGHTEVPADTGIILVQFFLSSVSRACLFVEPGPYALELRAGKQFVKNTKAAAKAVKSARKKR